MRTLIRSLDSVLIDQVILFPQETESARCEDRVGGGWLLRE